MTTKNSGGPSLALDEPKVKDATFAPTLEDTLGSGTGEDDNALETGGWAGTDDATSTAPSDLAFQGPERPMNHVVGGEDEAIEDSTGRADAGGFSPGEGGVVDFTGAPVEESRDWENDAVLPNERMREATAAESGATK